MDYEKKYNEALERAKYYHDRDNIQFLENIFPELEESEDERIRKSLIDMLKNDEKCYLKEIAWLEKQGEHSVSPLFTFEDVLTIQCAMAYAKFQDRELDVALKKLHDKVYDAYHDSKNHHIESQDCLKGEQKPYGKREECYDCQMNYGGTCKGSCAMKRGEQKHVEWSEEDEEIYQSIMDDTVQENQLSGKQTDWLRNIKYRHFPQPKQEWSEEDEKQARQIVRIVRDGGCTKKLQKQIADWLKSLKDRVQPQNAWKPSDEQIQCLYDAIEHYQTNGYPATKLKELYEQMQKIYKL